MLRDLNGLPLCKRRTTSEFRKGPTSILGTLPESGTDAADRLDRLTAFIFGEPASKCPDCGIIEREKFATDKKIYKMESVGRLIRKSYKWGCWSD